MIKILAVWEWLGTSDWHIKQFLWCSLLLYNMNLDIIFQLPEYSTNQKPYLANKQKMMNVFQVLKRCVFSEDIFINAWTSCVKILNEVHRTCMHCKPKF